MGKFKVDASVAVVLGVRFIGLKKLRLPFIFKFLLKSPTRRDRFLALAGKGFSSRGLGVKPKYSLSTYGRKLYLMYFYVSTILPRLGTEVSNPEFMSYIFGRLRLVET